MSFDRPAAALRCAVALLASAAASNAQTFAVADGTWPGPLDVRALPAATWVPTPTPLLASVVLVDLEITNRMPDLAARVGRARLLETDGVRHVVLPDRGGDSGSLWGYRKADGSGAGFLHCPGTGNARVLLQRPAALGGASPFADRLAIAPDGRHALVAGAAGDRLWMLRLDGVDWPGTGAPAQPVALPAGVLVELPSLTAGATHGFVVTDDGRLRRVPWADGAVLQDVTPTGQPAGSETEDQLAPSGDGSVVAFLHGPRDLESLWLVGGQGPAVRLPPPPAKYEEATYLPDVATGSRFQLNDRGTRLLYVDSTVRDEVFVLDTTGALPTNHVTGDLTFQPYIGTIILPSFAADTLYVGVGDPAAFDVYAAEAGPAPASTTNLTRTAGAGVPFASGTLTPRAVQPLLGGVLVHARDAGGGSRVAWYDSAGAGLTLARSVRAIRRGTAAVDVPGAGDWILESVAGPTTVVGGSGAVVLPGAVDVVGSVDLGLGRLWSVEDGGVATWTGLGVGATSWTLAAGPAPTAASLWNGRVVVTSGASVTAYDPAAPSSATWTGTGPRAVPLTGVSSRTR